MSACAVVSGRDDYTACDACPAYPIAGPAVAAELEKIDPKDFPHTIEWIQRLDKHATQHEEQEG